LAKDNKRSTGIAGLDLTMDGGFPFGTAIVVLGSPLAGVDHMARQFWSVDKDSGSYLMIDGDVETGMSDARGATPEDLLSLSRGDRIVIDSLSSIILRFGFDEGLACMARAKQEICSRKGNVMFVLYSELHQTREEIQILRMADVVLELKEVIFMNEIERQLAVHKVKDMAVPKRLIPFNITEKGIELSTTSRVV